MTGTLTILISAGGEGLDDPIISASHTPRALGLYSSEWLVQISLRDFPEGKLTGGQIRASIVGGQNLCFGTQEEEEQQVVCCFSTARSTTESSSVSFCQLGSHFWDGGRFWSVVVPTPSRPADVF